MSEPGPGIDLSVVIPMYNEAARIGPTLRDVVATLAGVPMTSEVLAVDDGSRDSTVDAVNVFLREDPQGSLRRVRLIRHEQNRGKGAAVQTGLAAAQGRRILMMDADNACRVSEVEKLIARADATGAALVVGSRATPDAQVETTLSRRFMGRVFHLAMRLLGLGAVSDTQCGFKLYRADLARLIVEKQREERFAFDVEHLLLARLGGFGIAEVGVVWRHVEGGTIRAWRDPLSMLWRAIKIRARHLRWNEAAPRSPSLSRGSS